jgi:hypothetical protein
MLTWETRIAKFPPYPNTINISKFTQLFLAKTDPLKYAVASKSSQNLTIVRNE